MKTPADRLHALADKLWKRALDDKDYSYKPFAIRIDKFGWHMLLGSNDAYRDGSLDRYCHPDKRSWRNMVSISEHAPIEAMVHDIKEVSETDILKCEILAIESRQSGPEGRRKYYDATKEELDAVFSGEGW